jgi:hypothetical protein
MDYELRYQLTSSCREKIVVRFHIGCSMLDAGC